MEHRNNQCALGLAQLQQQVQQVHQQCIQEVLQQQHHMQMSHKGSWKMVAACHLDKGSPFLSPNTKAQMHQVWVQQVSWAQSQVLQQVD